MRYRQFSSQTVVIDALDHNGSGQRHVLTMPARHHPKTGKDQSNLALAEHNAVCSIRPKDRCYDT